MYSFLILPSSTQQSKDNPARDADLKALPVPGVSHEDPHAGQAWSFWEERGVLDFTLKQ